METKITRGLGILLCLALGLGLIGSYYLGYLTSDRESKNKIVVIGIDAATWDIIIPMVERGEMPNFANLMEEGAYGNLTSMYPILSPRIWTSIATGKVPEKHGILGFVINESSEEREFYTSNMRKTKAIWNILSENNRSVGIVAWLVEYPPEEVNGFVITDRVTNPHVKDSTYPRELSREARPVIDVHLDEITKKNIANESRSDEFFTLLGLHFKEQYDPDFFAVYMRQTDGMGHRYWDRNISGVEDHYRVVDGLVGKLTEDIDEDTTVIIISDHGFGSINSSLEGLNRTLSSHRINGIILMAGPNIKRGRIENASVLDMTPTFLYLMDLPVALDMDGRILTNAIKRKYLNSNPIKIIDSYDEGWVGNATPAKSAADRELLEKLKALGYVK